MELMKIQKKKLSRFQSTMNLMEFGKVTYEKLIKKQNNGEESPTLYSPELKKEN
jgi:hypothetical protein